MPGQNGDGLVNEVLGLTYLVVWGIADPTSDPVRICLLSGKVSESNTLDHASVGDEVHLTESIFWTPILEFEQ